MSVSYVDLNKSYIFESIPRMLTCRLSAVQWAGIQRVENTSDEVPLVLERMVKFLGYTRNAVAKISSQGSMTS